MNYIEPLSQTDKKWLHERELRVDAPLAKINGLTGLHLNGLIDGQTIAVDELMANAFICQLAVSDLSQSYQRLETATDAEAALIAFSAASQQIHERLHKIMQHYEAVLNDGQLLHDQVRANFYAAEPDGVMASITDGKATNQMLAFHALLGMSADAQWLMEMALQFLHRLNPALTTTQLQMISTQIADLVAAG
ncbi:hypothetical protein [Furfurilactobacillus curtus]|uniref:Uncharacterized protein n=1 Tax=Furfurilactobacillus curtus TaxID=1746200 RepID=A0ABQ5JPK5_9LACO